MRPGPSDRCADDAESATPEYGAPPPGRHLPLLSGRSCFVRETGKGQGRPAVLLLHGWLASGGLNWMRAFDSLSDHYRVLAPDFRGHARGGPCHNGFSIEACADDMAGMLEHLDPSGPVIVVGYSMGGMVAQQLWRRHREQVAGLVLSATSCAPVPMTRGRDPFARAMNVAHATTRNVQRGLSESVRFVSSYQERLKRPRADSDSRSNHRPGAVDESGFRGWGGARDWARREFARHHWPTVIDAGRAIAEFDTRSWISTVDVPTTVMLTKRDRLVPPSQQREMASRIPRARVESVDAGHFACVREDFGPRILRSVRGVEKAMA